MVPELECHAVNQPTTIMMSWIRGRVLLATASVASLFLSACAAPLAGPRPIKDSSGHYPCLIHAIESRQVTEPKVKNFISIERPRIEPFEGTEYWAIPVTYRLDVVFGHDIARTRALIRNEQVIHWWYYGSDEVVP